MTLEFRYHLAREFWGESQIVDRVNNQGFAFEPGKLLEVRHWTDGSPQVAQTLQVNLTFQTLAHVAC